MKSRAFILLFCLLISGCGDTGQRTPVTVTIYQVLKTSEWPCNSGFRTYVTTDDGRTDYLCGNWGPVGKKISGYWITGHWEYSANGFRRF